MNHRPRFLRAGGTMKRYDLCEGEGCGCHMEEEGGGDYYLVADVEATMIERPSEEVARKAVARYRGSVRRFGTLFDIPQWDLADYLDLLQRARSEEEQAETALLRLMGVEVK